MTGKFRERFTSLFKLRQRFGKDTSSKRKSRDVVKDDVTASEDSTVNVPDPSGTWQISVKRLMKEICEIQRYHATLKSEPPFTVELVNDNLFEWYVRLYQIDTDSALASDMRKAGLTHILLHLIFPYNFPFSPPFMYVVTPSIENGFVMSGGAICMELLMPRGWACAYTAEAVIMQFAATVTKGQGRLADSSLFKKESTREKAEKVFQTLLRVHEKHGWVSPPRLEG